MAQSEKYAELADKVVGLLGGKDNISFFTHCVTRLRFNVKDKGLVDVDAISKLPGAVGAQWSGDQLQVIIGQSVGEAYDLVCEKNGLAREDGSGDDAAGGKDAPRGKLTPGDAVKAVIQAVSSCILPALPAMIGTSLVKTIALLLNMAGLLADTSSTYQVMVMLGDAGMYFMPLIVAYTAAQHFKCSPAISMGLVSILVFPTFATALTEGTVSTIFGIPIYQASYSGLLFPSIIIVFVTSFVERFVKSHMPKMFEYFLTPIVTMLVMLPLMLCALAPVGMVIGSAITSAIMALYGSAGFLAVGVLAAIWPLLIVFGMHYATIPAMTQCWIDYGYDPLIYPANLIYNFSMGAAALAVAIRSKRSDTKATASGVGVTAILGGITEPALFGIGLRYKTPLIATVIGGLVGGVMFGVCGCGMFTPGGSGILSFIAFIGPDPTLFVLGVASVVVAMVVTFVLTLVLFHDESASDAQEA